MFIPGRDCFVAHRRRCKATWEEIAKEIDVSVARAQTINGRFRQRMAIFDLCHTEPDEEFWRIIEVIAKRYQNGQPTIDEEDDLEQHIRNLIRPNV